jgi:hypothetical protein
MRDHNRGGDGRNWGNGGCSFKFSDCCSSRATKWAEILTKLVAKLLEAFAKEPENVAMSSTQRA